MNKKIYLITILAILVTTLSQTVSFISGEHQFYQSVQDKCIKCHGDIKNQLSASTNHSSSSCNYCHVKSATNHTNTNPACQDCHNTTQKLNDSLEAHTDFSSMGSKGCIACHTTYNTLVNYSRAEYIDYTITNNNGNWVISNITTIGTLNLSYNARRTGGDHDIQNVSCRDCHEDIFEAVSLGGHAVVLAKNSTNGTQVPYHNDSNTNLEAWCRTCHGRNDANFSTLQHSVRRTTCEECHQAYNSTPHPGNFFTNINTVPHLYRSLVCTSCHSIGWPAPGGGIHFKVHQEPYFDVTYEIIEPLLITNSTPASDPTTTVGTAQAFSITLNRPADIYWYNNGSEVFRALSVISSSYSSSNAGIGVYNITATADDGSATVSRIWNWTVTNQTGNGTGGGGGSVPGGGIITGSASGPGGSNNISGYVFDNNVLALSGVQVQNGSYQNTTNISGFYSITNLPNGTYTFSYSKAGFDTGYSIFTLNGASVENVNVIIYDTTPPASVSNISTAGGNFYINNTWVNPIDADFNYTWFRYDNGTTLQNINSSTDYLNLTWSPHYIQNISAQTVDTYNNINPAQVWFNATVPNNAPVQLQVGNKTVDEGQPLSFTVSAADADNDTITYGTNATKGDFNSTTGNFSWVPTYGDAGVYNWYFNSSDNYGGISTENIAVTVNNVPLSIINSSPVSDPTTIAGSSQIFSITLNRTADIIWYNNGSEAFRVLNVTSATYINSTAGVGTYNITAFANDSYDSVSRSWNWTVAPNINGTNVSGGGDGGGGSGGSNNSVSGYVSDNSGLSLGGVIVLNGSYQNTTDASGYYSIANLSNGTYNFSYSKAGFSTAYFEFTLNGAVVMNANRTLYDIMPAGSVSNPAMTTGNFYVNNTWINPTDVDFNYTWFRYSNDTTLQNVSKPVNYLNLTWQPHYTQNISAQTVDTSGNANQTKVWFNATIPNNAPFQYAIGNKVINENENLQFNVTATDADNDSITYGTNATKGDFNTTTGNFSWTPGYGDAGFYFWNFNSSDGYGGISTENIAVTVSNAPLSITSSLPTGDPTTTVGMPQMFGVALNRIANVTWYINDSIIQKNSSVMSADHTNSTASVGKYNVTAIADDSYYSVSRTWNWTVIEQPTYNVSGYVFDNYGSGLGGVLVQNSSYQNTTLASGYYQITGLFNGTYNFSYSKAGFNTGYLEVAVNGTDITGANKTIYDTVSPASVSNPASATGNFYINNTWANPTDVDFNYTWFKYSNGTNLQNISSSVSYLNLTWSPHYTQNISAQTVDTYGNINQTEVWFNATIPNNPPAQSSIGDRTITAGSMLQFNVTATDADSDQITYGMNATNGILNSTTGTYSWQTGSSDVGTYVWYFNSSDNYGGAANETITVTVTAAPPSKYIPPIPSNLIGTQGNFWINNSWEAGTGNATDSYNISVNGSWINGTTNTYYNDTVGPHGWSNITVWAYNNSDGGSLSSVPVSQSTQVANNVPLQTAIESKVVNEGDLLAFTMSATDADNDTITYGTNATKGNFDTTTGNFSWLTTYSDAGVYTWYFNSSDGYGGIANETITITVNNTPLSVTSSLPLSDPTTTQGTAQTFNVTLNRTANVIWYMNGMQVQTDAGTTSASYTNSTAGTGTWNVTASATDNIDTVSKSWNWTVNALPPATYIPPDPANLQNTTGSFWVNHTWLPGTGNNTDSYNVSVNGTWYNGTTDTFKNSTTTPHGWVNITVWAYNSSGTGSLSAGSISQDTQVANNPPSQDLIGDKAIDEGQLLTFKVNVTDADNDTVTYGTNVTKGTFNTTTGDFSWVPAYGDAGVYIWYFNSSDGYGGVASENVTVTVNNVPLSITSSAPASDPSTTADTPQIFEIALNRTADVTWYINGSTVQTNSSAAYANYTNSTAGAGIYNITAVANDGYDSTSKQWNWTVVPQPVYTPGIISWSNSKTNNGSLELSVNTSETVNFNATANQTITTWNWYLDGVNQNNNNDNLTTSWITSGTKSIQVNATNSNGTSNTATWTVTVLAQPTTYIPPSPANINSTTGNFWVNTTWEPGAGNITDSYNVSVNGVWTNGTTNTYTNSPLFAHAWQNVTVYAYNASGNGSLSTSPAMKDTQVPNNPPVLVPTENKSADEGQWLNFTVNATDADNDLMTYGTNATKGDLNATTGNFSWLITYSDAGAYVWYFNSSDGYGGVTSEIITVTVNNTPLSITSFLPPSDPTTTQGTEQTFNVTLNRTANVIWYMNGMQVQTDAGTTSASYTNSTAGIGTWNVTASATDGIDIVPRTWNWTVNTLPPTNYIPPDPTSLQNTTGSFWVNHTWLPGAGNIIDSYNVSVNGTWYNGTINTYYNNTIGPHGWSNISVWAYNSSGTGSLSAGSVSQDTQIPNNLPTQNPIGNKNVIAGDLLTFTVSAMDADNDTITYGTNATAGALNYTTGVYSWQTGGGDVGSYVWYFNASDNYEGVASETITVTVNNAQLSITSSSPASDPVTTQGTSQTFSVDLSRSANMTWYMNSTEVQTNSSATSASYTNSTAGAGVYNVTVIASDGIDTASRTWNWTVNAPSPVNFIPPAPVNLQNTTGNFWVNHTWQPGTGNLTDSYNTSVNGSWTNGTANNYDNSTVGPHGWSNITVYAYNASGTGTLSTSPVSQNIQVANNMPNQTTIGNKTITAGDLLTFNVSATDADNDSIIYGTNATNGTLNNMTGNYSWQTTSNDVGAYVWYFNSSDNYGGTASETVTITVNGTAPVSKTVTLVANSTGNTGFSAQTTGENLYSTTISNAQVGTRTSLSTANRNALSVDDTSYVTRTGAFNRDAIMVVNYTLSNVTSVNWVSLKFVGAVTTTSEPLIIGLYNATSPSGGGWTILNTTTPPVGTYITLTYNVTSQADKDKYLVLNGNTLTFSFAEWVNGPSNAGLSNDLYEATINYI